MRTSKRKVIIIFLIIVALLFVFKIGLVAFDNIANKLGEIFSTQVEDVIKETAREEALMELSQLRGRVEQLIRFYTSGKVSDSTISYELNYISFYQNSANPYTQDFAITITASDIGEVCEEILSQIDDQIYKIRFGTQGE